MRSDVSFSLNTLTAGPLNNILKRLTQLQLLSRHNGGKLLNAKFQHVKDHGSYVPKLCSCEKKAPQKKSHLNGIQTLSFSSTGAVLLPRRSQANPELVAL